MLHTFKNTSRKDAIVLVFILAVHIVCWLLLKPPVPHSDDLCYVQEGEKIIRNTYHINESPKNHRFVVILPALILTRVFGSNPHIISLWPLLCSLATITVLYFYLLRISKKAVIIFSLLLSLNIIQIIYSTVLFPDIICAFFASACLIFVYKGRGENVHAMRNAVWAIIAFAVGFFSKEIILLVLPFCFFMFVHDCVQKKGLLFWRVFYCSFFVFVFLILCSSFALTGDALFFYKSVEQNHNLVFAPALDNINLLKRLTIEPVGWLFNQYGYIFLFLFAVPSLVFSRHIEPAQQQFYFFWRFYFFALLITYWLGSTSLHHFAPVLLLDRMWMLLLLPLCILSAKTISEVLYQKESNAISLFLILIFVVAGFFSVCFATLTKTGLFLSFAAAVYISRKTRSNKKIKRMQPLLILLPYVVLAFYFIFRNSNNTF